MLLSTVFSLFSLLACAWAQNDCYYAAGKRAGSAIIPCGGSTGFSSCCQIGDLCLSDSACWNPSHNVTYLYGCNDPSYQDPTCPWKCGPTFVNAPYVGLDYCYNTTQNEWSCTHPPSNSESIQQFSPQQCLDDSIIAFAGPSSLQPILSLPTNVGGKTVWFSEVNPTSYIANPNYTPTTTSIAVTASVPTGVEVVSTRSGTDTSTSPTAPIIGVSGSSASSSSAPTGSAAPVSSTPRRTGLSSGAKIGLGVGIAGVVVGLVGLGVAFFLYRRRNNPRPVSQMEEVSTNENVVSPPKIKSPKGPSELPAPVPGELGETDYAGAGASSTAASWGSPAPTYSKTTFVRKPGGDTVHEMG